MRHALLSLLLLCASLPTLSAATLSLSPSGKSGETAAQAWPDGTAIDPWFERTVPTPLAQLGTPFVLTDHGVLADSTLVQTAAIQAVIDQAAREGGGVVVVPRGTFLSGALFLRQDVHLWICEGGKLKGSEDITDFPLCQTRIEGQTCRYFPALINGDSLSGTVIGGEGTIDGNGLRYWKAFWLRRSWNPQCTNKDEQRPRLVYLQHCQDVEINGLWLKDSPFWTTHIYKCTRVKYLGVRITSPASPVKAPSTDAIDIDACTDVHVSGCFMEVNDDAIALKGGKGPWADTDQDNGANERILVEDCQYGFCHGCLTCGSESVHNRNIILRRISIGHAQRLLWLKMRPDTPQHYEYIHVSDITGQVTNFLFIQPWTQFFDLQGREDIPLSVGEHVTMERCRMEVGTVFNVGASEQYRLSDFTLRDLTLTAEKPDIDTSLVTGLVLTNCQIEKAE